MDADYHNVPFDFENYNGDWIEDGKDKPTDVMVYDYLCLYGGCEFSKELFSEQVQRQIRIAVVEGDRVAMNRYIDSKNYVQDCYLNITRRLANPRDHEADEIIVDNLTEGEKLHIRKKIRENFKYLNDLNQENKNKQAECLRKKTIFTPDRPYNINTKEALLAKIRRTSLYFFTRGRGTFSEKIKENRTYHALSSLPKNLRIALLTKYVCFDINSANPSFICNILGIPNG